MPKPTTIPSVKTGSRWLRRIFWCAAICVCAILLLVVALFVFLNRVPSSYPAASNPIPPPTRDQYSKYALDGFESPYLGHTGSWDGKGGAIFGGSKENDLDHEVAMGLRWTFMPVNWRALEPTGSVDLTINVPSAWRALDAFVIQAHKRKLNILFQAPVVGGNAEGPPDWAGRREPGKSAPFNMDAAAQFAGKLAVRYRPGGTLATEQGWGEGFGVRAWEIENEPEMYRTHWKGQAGDYAEFATKVAREIRAADPLAFVILPGVASGKHKAKWLEGALNAEALQGSPIFKSNAIPYSIGPLADAVSFHVYEGLDSAFANSPRTIEVVWSEVRAIFEYWEKKNPGFQYDRIQEYWHTEGNFDFIGALSEKRRAAWRIQFLTRAFAAGVRKVCVMDASKLEAIAVKTYTEILPWPFPMEPADSLETKSGSPVAFRHNSENKDDQQRIVWILWAKAGTGDAVVEIPVNADQVQITATDGSKSDLSAANGKVTIQLPGDEKMAAPLILVDEGSGSPTKLESATPSSTRKQIDSKSEIPTSPSPRQTE